MSTPAAGWYPDPSNPSMHRYWDGSSWTQQTRPANAAQAPQQQAAPAQPAGHAAAASAGDFDPWFWQSIVATLMCCLPVGAVGIFNSSKAKDAWAVGNWAEAQDRAAKAKKWTLASIVLGVLFTALWFVLAVVGAAMDPAAAAIAVL